jgi:hypothetical protein
VPRVWVPCLVLYGIRGMGLFLSTAAVYAHCRSCTCTLLESFLPAALLLQAGGSCVAWRSSRTWQVGLPGYGLGREDVGRLCKQVCWTVSSTGMHAGGQAAVIMWNLLQQVIICNTCTGDIMAQPLAL